jgi:hypothetical protein
MIIVHVILICQLITTLLFIGLLILEKVARRKPDSSFTKWWRANVIGDDIYKQD